MLSLLLHLVWIDGVNLHWLHYYLKTDWQCVCWGYYVAAETAVVAADSDSVTAIANIYM
jgi:2-keto-3-deoxy-6-phosphogluconate aldolase